MKPRTVALIPAAGEGRRFGSLKQFLHLLGRPLLVQTLQPFQQSPWIDEVVLIVPVGWVNKALDIVKSHEMHKVKKVVPGGRQRQDSVRRGLEALEPTWDLVVIHDGVRPLLTEEIIERSVAETLIHGATFVGVPATDTLAEINSEGRMIGILHREKFWHVQTPQTFRYELILRAHRQANQDGFTGADDASLVSRLGVHVSALEGSYDNIKVTSQVDLKLAEEILLRRSGHRS